MPWNQTSVTVSGLAGNSQYFLTVSAFNTAGTGPFLPAINVTTKKPRKPAGETLRRGAGTGRINIYLKSHWAIWFYNERLMCFVFISCSTDSAALEYRMDPNWLSAVSLLGACGGRRVGVRCYGVPSECHGVGANHDGAATVPPPARSQLSAGKVGMFTKCHPRLFFCSAVLPEAAAQGGKHAHHGQLHRRADPPRGGGRLHHPRSDAERRRPGSLLRANQDPPNE